MNFKIIEKPSFTIFGIKRNFNSDNSYEEIPKFWDEAMKTSEWENGLLKGCFGLCYDENGKNFSYMIGGNYENQQNLPDNFEKVNLPSNLYAIFPCKGKRPEALQNINTKIMMEWIPNNKKYEKNGNYCIEAYFEPEYAEIWIPVRKI